MKQRRVTGGLVMCVFVCVCAVNLQIDPMYGPWRAILANQLR